jgi:Ca2+-binding EF-hand superfamily protein
MERPSSRYGAIQQLQQIEQQIPQSRGGRDAAIAQQQMQQAAMRQQEQMIKRRQKEADEQRLAEVPVMTQITGGGAQNISPKSNSIWIDRGGIAINKQSAYPYTGDVIKPDPAFFPNGDLTGFSEGPLNPPQILCDEEKIHRGYDPPPAVKLLNDQIVKAIDNQERQHINLNSGESFDESMRNFFMTKDLDKNGLLEITEIQKFAEEASGTRIQKKDAEELMRYYDRNGNGVVSYEEFAARVCWTRRGAKGMPPPTPSSHFKYIPAHDRFQHRLMKVVDLKVRDGTYRSKDDALRGLFQQYDRDSNGMLQLPELAAAIRQDLSLNFSDKEIREVMSFYDNDHSATASYDELSARQCWNHQSDIPPPTPKTTNEEIEPRKRFQRRLLQVAKAKKHDKTYRTLNDSLHGLFIQYDRDSNGRLQLEEIHEAVQKHMGLKMTRDQCQEVLNYFDKDHSASCSYQEIANLACWHKENKNGMPPPTAGSLDKEKPADQRFTRRLLQMAECKVLDGTYRTLPDAVRGVFIQYDGDSNGRIQLPELRKCIVRALELPWGSDWEEVANVMKQFDSDHRGTMSWLENWEHVSNSPEYAKVLAEVKAAKMTGSYKTATMHRTQRAGVTNNIGSKIGKARYDLAAKCPFAGDEVEQNRDTTSRGSIHSSMIGSTLAPSATPDSGASGTPDTISGEAARKASAMAINGSPSAGGPPNTDGQETWAQDPKSGEWTAKFEGGERQVVSPEGLGVHMLDSQIDKGARLRYTRVGAAEAAKLTLQERLAREARRLAEGDDAEFGEYGQHGAVALGARTRHDGNTDFYGVPATQQLSMQQRPFAVTKRARVSRSSAGSRAQTPSTARSGRPYSTPSPPSTANSSRRNRLRQPPRKIQLERAQAVRQQEVAAVRDLM